MDDLTGKVYQITPTQPKSVKVSYTLKKIKGYNERIVVIDEWFQWGQGYIGTDKNLNAQDGFADCDMKFGCEFEDTVAINYSFSGDGWTEKDQHRIQKDYSRGAVDRILENDPDWYLTASKFYIDAPFRVNVVDPPENPQTHRTHARASKKSLLTKKEQL